jgi:hypothetical protein
LTPEETNFLLGLFYFCSTIWVLKVIVTFLLGATISDDDSQKLDNWVEGDPPIEFKKHTQVLLVINFILYWLFFFNSAIIVAFLLWRLLL